MKTVNAFKLSLLALSIAGVSQAHAGDSGTIASAVKDSKVNASFRYRVESVDQDGISEKALASTLKSRVSVTTGSVSNLSAKVEIDNVSNIGSDKFNSTVNGNGMYPVVADPKGTELNQAYVQYKNGGTSAIIGRQRIVLDDQRFVGGVAWRQNEQTYDGYRLKSALSDNFTVDASYVYNVNRIFGESSAKSDLHGDIFLLNAKYALSKGHSITAYNYSLDFDNAAGASSNTIGATYNGKFDNVSVKAGYASQSDTGDRADFSADYMVLEAMVKLDGFKVGAGYEVLGSDDGMAAFSTPLATLHKFQGFSDKFLGTPANGIEDVYVKGATKVGKVGLSAAYHVYTSDEGSIDYGKEINVAAKYKINKNVGGLLKLANYSADDHASDTTKIWLMLTAKY